MKKRIAEVKYMPITVFSFGRRHLLTFNSLGDTVRKRIDG